MRWQTLLHVAVLAAVAALGVWVVRLDLDPGQSAKLGEWSGIAGALYWFVALSFALISSLWLLAGRRRGWRYFLTGYILALGVSAAGGWFILRAGQQAAHSGEDPNRLELPQLRR